MREMIGPFACEGVIAGARFQLAKTLIAKVRSFTQKYNVEARPQDRHAN